MSKKLAHIATDGRTQTILQHLQGTAIYAAEFGEIFGEAEIAEYTAMLHDIGKYSDAFQKRLQGGIKVDHATAGAYEAIKRKQKAAAFCIAGHHGGLPDGGSRSDISNGTLMSRLNKAKNGMIEPYSDWEQEVVLPNLRPVRVMKESREAIFYIRMLYSCLVDADYLNTEEFMQNKKRERSIVNFEELARRFDKYIAPWFPAKTILNEKRCQILLQCKKIALEGSGIFTLTVPTGGGKTVASMAFALQHARKNNHRRIIYIVPYTSIIEQNAEVFRDILGENIVLEHHSAVNINTDESEETALQFIQATENWDANIIVTTAVQFFESLFSNKPSSCRKLHNIANSVLIFDEAQMIPLAYLRPCVYAIAQLVQNYKCSAVLCTATQPALNSLVQEYFPGVSIREICPEDIFDDDVFKRVRYINIGRKSVEELSIEISGYEQILCVVNTRKKAQELFEQLPKEGAYHLSTLMYPVHRRQILQEIRRRLKEGLPCRVISTSLIEAGVDVDFPLVYREESGLDSILQVGGRCNREGKRDPGTSLVKVFSGEEATVPLFSAQAAAGRNAMKHYQDWSSKEAVAYYFRELYDLKGEKAQDIKEIMRLLQEQSFPFATIAERFHLIENDTITLYIPIGGGEELIQAVKNGRANKKTYQQLQRYGVALYSQHYQKLFDAGCIEIIEGIPILRDLNQYDSKTGLSLKQDSGSALFI